MYCTTQSNVEYKNLQLVKVASYETGVDNYYDSMEENKDFSELVQAQHESLRSLEAVYKRQELQKRHTQYQLEEVQFQYDQVQTELQYLQEEAEQSQVTIQQLRQQISTLSEENIRLNLIAGNQSSVPQQIDSLQRQIIQYQNQIKLLQNEKQQLTLSKITNKSNQECQTEKLQISSIGIQSDFTSQSPPQQLQITNTSQQLNDKKEQQTHQLVTSNSLEFQKRDQQLISQTTSRPRQSQESNGDSQRMLRFKVKRKKSTASNCSNKQQNIQNLAPEIQKQQQQQQQSDEQSCQIEETLNSQDRVSRGQWKRKDQDEIGITQYDSDPTQLSPASKKVARTSIFWMGKKSVEEAAQKVEQNEEATGNWLLGTWQQKKGQKISKEIQYQEVVRKKNLRGKLPGHGCPDCDRFYDALRSWNTIIDRPACGHISEKLNKQALLQEASRHRRKFEIPQTPEGYWENGFNDTLEREYANKVLVDVERDEMDNYLNF
eukprot:TRINITY_DN58594_c0_g1_i2.p1 TRINITY_DN58594_c0_g1~~TRINITY_DN58594_c0_g1_i2.p1  ORF type:complete len:490 (-),score=64.06 TRINITY_DN58594_c0_g1_i2:182-1651(-)